MIWLMRATFCVLFLLLIFATYLWGLPSFGLGFDGATFPWIQFFITAIAMLTGIFFGSLYRRLSGIQTDNVIISREIRSVVDSVSFWRAICVAPLVFLAIYTAVGGMPGDIPSVLLAFQNGFFWENVLKKQGA
ncbi:hypothetical protein ACDY97_19380 [Rhizobium mongolense]|uniref:hypothetical protein n=1 Tax=Rhizobium mongolense TaxID=57676 RepID=UPI003555D78C